METLTFKKLRSNAKVQFDKVANTQQPIKVTHKEAQSSVVMMDERLFNELTTPKKQDNPPLIHRALSGIYIAAAFIIASLFIQYALG